MAIMRVDFRWLTDKGTRTSDNRDCAGIGENAHGSIIIVADGSTAGELDGDLARALVKEIVNWFVIAKPPVSADVLLGFLRDLHRDLAPHFPRGSVSYLIVIMSSEGSVIAHAGDCTLGFLGTEGSVNWITAPHTLANAVKKLTLADIAKSRARHLLTYSFRAREFVAPTIEKIDALASHLVIATDGFWADLTPDQQMAFMGTGKRKANDDQDDCSVLLIRTDWVEHTDDGRVALDPLPGLYLRRVD